MIGCAQSWIGDEVSDLALWKEFDRVSKRVNGFV